MKSYSKLIIFPLIAVLLILGYRSLKSNAQTPQLSNPQVQSETKASLKITIEGQEKAFDLSGYVGQELLASMQKAGVKVEKEGEGEMTFVTALEGRKANSEKREFWEFLVNGGSSQVGAGVYAIQNGDQIEWKISTY